MKKRLSQNNAHVQNRLCLQRRSRMRSRQLAGQIQFAFSKTSQMLRASACISARQAIQYSCISILSTITHKPKNFPSPQDLCPRRDAKILKHEIGIRKHITTRPILILFSSSLLTGPPDTGNIWTKRMEFVTCHYYECLESSKQLQVILYYTVLATFT